MPPPRATLLPLGGDDELARLRREVDEQTRLLAERQAQQRKAPSPRFAAFGRRYLTDPVAFAYDCFAWPEGQRLAPYQEEVLDAVPRERFVTVRGPHSLGKCLAMVSIIPLADGTLIPAGELIGKRFRVQAVDEVDALRVVEADAYATDNGVKPLVRVTTDRGRILEVTPNHPLWCDPEPYKYHPTEYKNRLIPTGRWVAAGKIPKGATIATYVGNEGPRYARSEAEVKLCAYLIADGGLTNPSGVFWTKTDERLCSEFKEIVQELGATTTVAGPITLLAVGLPGRENTNTVLALTREWGLQGKRSSEKRFPAWVWTLPSEQLALFLNRLYAGDGWAHANTLATGSKNRQIGYCSVSEGLARDVSRALLRLGISAEVRMRKTCCIGSGGEKIRGIAWDCNVHDIEGLLVFCERVGIFGKEEAVERVRASCLSAGADHRQRWRRTGLPDHLRWERVASVEPLPPAPTVAITVPGYETYLTEFVEHNTALSAINTLWFALTSEGCEIDWKNPLTASVLRQLDTYLWPEVGKWARRLRWDVVGREPFNRRNELLTTGLVLRYGRAFLVAPEDYTKLEGVHADRVEYLFDESKAIPDENFDAAEGAFAGAGSDTTQEAYALMLSTPGPPSGRFFDVHARKPGHERWWVRHVTVDEAVRAGRVSAEWVRARALDWGEESPLFKNRVLGEFCEDAEGGMFPSAWVEAAFARHAGEETVDV